MNRYPESITSYKLEVSKSIEDKLIRRRNYVGFILFIEGNSKKIVVIEERGERVSEIQNYPFNESPIITLERALIESKIFHYSEDNFDSRGVLAADFLKRKTGFEEFSRQALLGKTYDRDMAISLDLTASAIKNVTVARVGSLVVGGFSFLCLCANLQLKTVIIDSRLAIILIVASITFFVMSLLGRTDG